MKVYLSHSIRGLKGDAATVDDQIIACDAAVAIGEQIIGSIPTLKLYVPGGPSEEFVGIAYRKKYLTEKQILDIDCTIIDGCEAVIVYVPLGDYLQGGRWVEYNHAVKIHKPVYIFGENEIDCVVEFLAGLIIRG